MKNIYVVTGGPGFGKTSIIKELRERGFNGGEELSREFIKEQMSGEGKLLPWIDRLGYSEEMLRRRIKQYGETPQGELWFLDRGVPDLIAYIAKDGLEVPEIYYESAKKYRYNRIVFLTGPWKDIHENDLERLESFEEAINIHKEIESTYSKLGYECVSIPKTPVAERVEFILRVIS